MDIVSSMEMFGVCGVVVLTMDQMVVTPSKPQVCQCGKPVYAHGICRGCYMFGGE